MGIATACASVSPDNVNRLAEASSPSLTIGENELFRSASSISLAMPSSLLRTTSTVTGSSAALIRASSSCVCSVEYQVAELVHPGAPGGPEQRGGVVLLDDGRAVKTFPRPQRRAVVNRGLDRCGAFGQQ